MEDHKVDDLELVTAGAVVETQSGPIIIIMNQCARMINGKTIHSSGQMEHHKVVVKDQAHAITNVVPYLEPHEGSRTPLCFINGFPYMKMRIPTDKELENPTTRDHHFGRTMGSESTRPHSTRRMVLRPAQLPGTHRGIHIQ